MKKLTAFIVTGLLVAFLLTNNINADTETSDVPVKGMVTMVDLGAKKCIPCKMMAPILESLGKKYKGRAAIVFIDIWQKENKKYVEKFGIQAIPTQIFFDKDGKEVYRHTGFLDKESIVQKLKGLGVG